MRSQQHIQMVFSLLERKDHIINDIEYGWVNEKLGIRRKGLHALWKIKEKLEEDLEEIKKSSEEYRRQIKMDQILRKFFGECNFRNYMLVYFRSYAESLKYLDGIKANTDEQEALKSQLIDLYGANIGQTERTLLNYLFGYYLREIEAGNIKNEDRIKRIEECWERTVRLEVINISDVNERFLEAKSADSSTQE